MFLGLLCPTPNYHPLVVSAFQLAHSGSLWARCCLQQFTCFCPWVLFYTTWIQVPMQCIMVIKLRLQ